jgi:Ni,Fe-hydrogenase III large subunit/Ni,Fe-hydrogenase III component G
MSFKSLLSHLPSVIVTAEQTDICLAHVPLSQFTGALDELVNCRTLAQATNGFLRRDATALYSLGLSLSHLYVTDDRKEKGTYGIHALLHDDTSQCWLHLSSEIEGRDPSYPSVSAFIMGAQWFERYNADMFGVIPLDHPDQRRLVHHSGIPLDVYPLRKDFAFDTPLERDDIPYPLHQVAGDGVHEIGVGPVHHRVAESVHYRLSATGERVMTLEVKPFYKHKGVEKTLEGKHPEEALVFIERLSGDSVFSHALAYCQAVESIDGVTVSMRSKIIRSFLNECERVIMHVEDISNIAGIGAGYASMKSGFGLKEKLRRAVQALCGNRFLRGIVVPGGLSREFTDEEIREVRTVFVDVIDDLNALLKTALRSDGLRDRLEVAGVLKKDAATVYGAVGLVARASGVDRDMRRDHPYAAYDRFAPKVITHVNGDVFARFKVRIDELIDSRRLLLDLAGHLNEGANRVPCHPGTGMGVGVTEGARGETLYVIHMKDGVLSRVAIKDPSFVNLPLLHEIIPTNILSDFPLCCRSLGISISGSDV